MILDGPPGSCANGASERLHPPLWHSHGNRTASHHRSVPCSLALVMPVVTSARPVHNPLISKCAGPSAAPAARPSAVDLCILRPQALIPPVRPSPLCQQPFLHPRQLRSSSHPLLHLRVMVLTKDKPLTSRRSGVVSFSSRSFLVDACVRSEPVESLGRKVCFERQNVLSKGGSHRRRRSLQWQ